MGVMGLRRNAGDAYDIYAKSSASLKNKTLAREIAHGAAMLIPLSLVKLPVLGFMDVATDIRFVDFPRAKED